MTSANPVGGEAPASDPRLDVIVIGGCQAGLALAWHLASGGCGSSSADSPGMNR
jgi:hypothetical protein